MSAASLLRSFRTRVWSLEDRLDLRLQIGLATSVLCFAIVAILAVGAASVGRREAVDAASAHLNAIAATYADRIDRAVSARQGLMRQLAALEPLRNAWAGPPEALRAVLDEARRNGEGVAWIGYATTDGTVRAATAGVHEGQSVAGDAWFRHGLVFPSVEDSSAAAPFLAAGNPAGGEVDPQRFIDIGVPVKDAAGKTIGVLGLHISRSWADRLRHSTTGALSDAVLGVLRGDGFLVVGDSSLDEIPEAERIDTIAANRTAKTVDRSGQLSGFAVTRGSAVGLGWLIVARRPAAGAFAAADQVVWTIVALGVLLGLAGILGSLLIAKRVSRPFSILADRAGLIGPDTISRLPRVRGSYEAVRLSIALRSLLLRIGSVERSRAEVQGRAADDAAKFNRDLAILKNLADLDVLTELFNRRAFMEYARDAMGLFWHNQRPFAVLMIDIDHFKRINDELGHPAGDIVIRSVASIIARTIRPDDKAARFGGEEFLVLLKDAVGPQAEHVAERVRAAIAGTPIDCDGHTLTVTASVGIALADKEDRDVQALIERADVALYAAKDAGRDQIALASVGVKHGRRVA